VSIRVVIADDNVIVREGVAALINADPELELVGSCEDLDSLLKAVETEKPDVLVTDIRMPPGGGDEGIRAARTLRETQPDVGVVVLSQFDEPEYALALLEDGSEGRAYLLKERISSPGELVAAVRAVASGGSVIDSKVVDSLVAARSRAKESPLAQLTPREREVLSEMAQGKDNSGIAQALFLTVRAVEKHINSIFSKLGLSEEVSMHRRVKAVLLYLSDT
jgi:DNA-binding NarL/FixJ family response regulator